MAGNLRSGIGFLELESDSTLPWVVWAISVVCFTLASLGEASLVSVRKERVQWLAAREVRGAQALESLYSTPLGPAGALSLLRYLFLASSMLSGAALVISRWDTQWGLISLVSLAVLALLGVAHAAAAALASALGEGTALRIASLLRGPALIFRPVLAVEARAVKLVGRDHADRADGLAEVPPGDLGISMDADGEPLDEREVRMIRGVVQLDKTAAREIMVPRVDIVAAELGMPLDDLAEQLVQSGHSRVPVYEGSLDHIQGIAYARDILGHLSRNKGDPGSLTARVVRPALFIPDSKTLEELLNEFQEKQVHIAIVIDEYGGVSGMVTIEDLLEEIVGEINDEFDVGEPDIEPVSDREFLMDARVSIDELNELLHMTVEGNGFDTIGGFVYQRLGKIPSAGDEVEYDGLKIQVVSTVGRRLKRLRVTRLAEDPEAA